MRVTYIVGGIKQFPRQAMRIESDNHFPDIFQQKGRPQNR